MDAEVAKKNSQILRKNIVSKAFLGEGMKATCMPGNESHFYYLP